jgi:hypothetical protein
LPIAGTVSLAAIALGIFQSAPPRREPSVPVDWPPRTTAAEEARARKAIAFARDTMHLGCGTPIWYAH